MKRKLFIMALTLLLAVVFVGHSLAGTTMDRILERGELLVGTTANQPPLTAKSKEGEIIGLDADLARLIALNMGVQVKFVTMPFAELLPALQAGKVDMILSSMSMIPGRNLKVAFIGPYFVSGKGILTKTKTIAALQEPAGLNNPSFRVAALSNSTSQKMVEENAPKAKLVTAKSYDEAMELLLGDKVDVMVADYPFCALTAYRYRDKGLTAGQARLTYEPLGIAMPEDALLMNWVQNFLIMLNGSGELKRISEYWMNDGSWVKMLP
jgi:polar amino acid transport system substrate-binding protein